MPRTAKIHRKTNETDITLRLNLDGRGKARISTGVRFFDHMLELVARHGAFDLDLSARGDLDVDQHHTVEDVGIALGEAVTKALGTKRGILRAGYFLMPMDETLAASAVDFGGRPLLFQQVIQRNRLDGDRLRAGPLELPVVARNYVGDPRQLSDPWRQEINVLARPGIDALVGDRVWAGGGVDPGDRQRADFRVWGVSGVSGPDRESGGREWYDGGKVACVYYIPGAALWTIK